MIKISFIIIGHNEGWKLELALKSVFDAIQFNKIEDISEVIYVDSNSTDNSLNIASMFPLSNIIKIIDHNFNAATARNLGAFYSEGEYLMFLDGDMQLDSSFFRKIFDETNNLKYNFVSGSILEHYYDENWKYLKKAFRTLSGNALFEDKYEVTVGGFFCVKHTLWNELNGMDVSLAICEDIDFGLRLSQRGILLLRKKELAVIHHTISPIYFSRFRKNLVTFNIWYYKYYGLLYRKHLLNTKILRKLARSEFTLFILLIISLFSIYLDSFFPIMSYPLFVFLRVWYHSRNKFFSIWDFVIIPVRDLTILFSFLFFFPKRNIDTTKYLKLILEKK